ncbi:M56 family metallopeptidase [Chryseobacterium sp. 2TAF14]|uniref:M56 family metallopeptidase n=1 Tax=Chryseobacterium sp. 2TAF14 TaxID=3233007 RepID=UPI003F8E9A0B
MLTIVLKIILCSGVLLGLYYLFLAKEKTFTFNRFFLISALVFSLCIPFVSIETKQAAKEIPETVFVETVDEPVETQIATPQENFDFMKALLIAYCIVSVILILKIGYSIIKIKTLKGRKLIYQNRNIFLLKQDLAPFSFLNTIYLSETYFKDSKIEDSVFLHEEIHIKQKHSLDILFVEILKAVFWINPFIYFYKKEMINNHEFIADERVINQNKNIRKYQELILQEILKQQNLPLIHQFNFNNTKKRFIMMTSKSSKFAKAKKYLTIPVFAVLAIVFAEKTYAKQSVENFDQETPNIISEVPTNDPYIDVKQSQQIDDEKTNNQDLKNDKTKDFQPVSKDTIPVKKNIEAKTTENKALDISTAVEGVAANFTPAEYPGGINEFRKKMSSTFDTNSLKGNNELIKTEIFMTIDENGKAININAVGQNEKFNNEAVRVAKLLNENVTWVPAKKDGEPVI